MPGGLSYNPFGLTNAPNTFGVESTGYYVGVAMDDPAVRNQLAGGVLAATETLPMVGGVAITEFIPGLAGGPVSPLGPLVGRAQGLGSSTYPMRGFSVYNQAHHMFASPISPAPIAVPGQSVHFYRFGSRARIPVACAASLAALRGQPSINDLSWDFVNQVAVPAQAAYAANAITAASWANTSGGQATYTTTSAHGVNPGSPVTISGMTPAGYNGTFTALPGTTGSTIVVAMPANPGTATAFGTLAAGGGVLPVNVLGFNVGNSMVPTYNPTTGYCTWTNTGSAVLIEI